MKTRKGWRLVAALVGCLAALAVSACEGDSDGNGGGGADVSGGGNTDTGGGGGGNTDTGGGGGTTDFPAGTFQLTTFGVEDNCLDGGLAILFQPDGAGTPYDLQYPTEFPAYDSLPQTFTMQLQDPFTDMQVTLVAGGESLMTVTDSLQSDLVVDADNYGDCTVDMLIDAEIVVVDADNIDVTATIEVSDWTSTGDTCPNVTSDPCTLVLDMKGVRQ